MGIGYVTWNVTVVSTYEEHRPGSLCWVNIVWTREPLTNECYSEISNEYWRCLSVGWPGRKGYLRGLSHMLTNVGRIEEWRVVKAWKVYILAVSNGDSYGILMLDSAASSCIWVTWAMISESVRGCASEITSSFAST